MNFRKIDLITGWVVFAIASLVYLCTMEPTASFWDCGEFILSAFKLEVGHPPGAPLFMMIGRLFTLFAGGNLELVPLMINAFSALCSGFTILFLYWTITHLARKMAGSPEGYSRATMLTVIGSGVVGALAYTFSDTFWFSAVEGEVYAFSSLFTAVVFWAVLKWEDQADAPHANRWLVLIAYLMGLSIGVHLLNLLAIPAIGLVYYFSKYAPVTPKGVIRAILVSAVVLGGILYIIVPGVLKIAVGFELFFVNQMGLPFNSGLIVYALLLVAALVFGIRITYLRGRQMAHTVLVCVSVIILGYCSYGAIVIRSAADTPMDQNDPQNIFNLQYYLNREQYGDRPLIKGQYYTAPIVSIKEGAPIYIKGAGKYEVVGNKAEYVYDSKFEGIFPRMYSSEADHISVYKDWSGGEGTNVRTSNPRTGLNEVIPRPTFGQNLRFFFDYQLGHMYFRYFMWNFAGRQNDLQDIYSVRDPFKGNWISGIRALDEARLGPQNIPDSLKNKAHNRYFLLPLLLGLAVMIFHFNRHRKDFWVVMALFVMTGIAIVVYLNQSPNQPRERDYAYAGSFYAFAIWIGLGMMALIQSLPERFRNLGATSVVTLAGLLLVPGLMARENWDDHDRSGRYVARDFGANFLKSCAPNAVIFTNGDNDTFPLWYAQEVEGVRTDVRVVNLSYFAADWYIDQTRRKAYESEPVKYIHTPDKYLSDRRNVAYVDDLVGGKYVALSDAIAFTASDDPKTKRSPRFKDPVDLFPAKNLIIPVDRQKVLTNGTVAPDRADKVLSEMRFQLRPSQGGGTEVLYKSHLMVLDMIASNNWDRPIYYAVTVTPDNYLGMDAFMRLEGFAYRLVPEQDTTGMEVPGNVEMNRAYDNLMNQFSYGNVADPKVYKDENMLRQLKHYRTIFARVSAELLRNNRADSAHKLMDFCMEQIPASEVPMDVYGLPVVEQYFAMGDSVRAVEMAREMLTVALEESAYFFSFPKRFELSLGTEKRERILLFRDLAMLCGEYGQKELEAMGAEAFEKYYYLFVGNR